MRTITRIFILLMSATAAAAFTNAVRGKPLAWQVDRAASANPGVNPELEKQVELTFDEFAAALRDGTATFVDARKPEEFSAGHIAGAINIPSTEKEQYIGTVNTALPRDRPVIIYCGGGQCEASNEVFEFLVGAGLDKAQLRIFKPGWELLGKRTDLPIAMGLE
ncbi:MAG: rhodanese-like domain-containing protein [Phycisphaerae bacterium]